MKCVAHRALARRRGGGGREKKERNEEGKKSGKKESRVKKKRKKAGTIGPFTKEAYNSHNYVNLSSSLCTLLAKSTAPSSLQLLVSTQDYVRSDVIGKVEAWRAAKSFRRCLLPPW